MHLFIILWPFGTLVDEYQLIVGHPIASQGLLVCKEMSGISCGRVYIFVDGLSAMSFMPTDIAVTISSPLEEVDGRGLLPRLEVTNAVGSLLFSSCYCSPGGILHITSTCAQTGIACPESVLIVLVGITSFPLRIECQIFILFGLKGHLDGISHICLLQQLDDHIMTSGQHLMFFPLAFLLSVHVGLEFGGGFYLQAVLDKHGVVQLESYQAHTTLS